MSFRFRSKSRTRMLLSGLMAWVTIAAKEKDPLTPEAQASLVRILLGRFVRQLGLLAQVQSSDCPHSH